MSVCLEKNLSNRMRVPPRQPFYDTARQKQLLLASTLPVRLYQHPNLFARVKSLLIKPRQISLGMREEEANLMGWMEDTQHLNSILVFLVLYTYYLCDLLNIR